MTIEHIGKYFARKNRLTSRSILEKKITTWFGIHTRAQSPELNTSQIEALYKDIYPGALQGFPGIGKTSFVRYAIHKLAQEAQDPILKTKYIACIENELIFHITTTVPEWNETHEPTRSLVARILVEALKKYSMMGYAMLYKLFYDQNMTIGEALSLIFEHRGMPEPSQKEAMVVVVVDETQKISVAQLKQCVSWSKNALLTNYPFIATFWCGLSSQKIQSASTDAIAENIPLPLLSLEHHERNSDGCSEASWRSWRYGHR